MGLEAGQTEDRWECGRHIADPTYPCYDFAKFVRSIHGEIDNPVRIVPPRPVWKKEDAP